MTKFGTLRVHNLKKSQCDACHVGHVSFWSPIVLAVALTISFTGSAMAADKCSVRSIGEVGKCQSRNFARKVVDRELRGLPSPTTSLPRKIDPDFLATQLLGKLAQGRMSIVAGGNSDWVLVASAAQTDGFQYRQQPILRPAFPLEETLFLLHWQDNEKKKSPESLRINHVREKNIPSILVDNGTNAEAEELPTLRVIASHVINKEILNQDADMTVAGGLQGVRDCVDPEVLAMEKRIKAGKKIIDDVPVGQDAGYPELSSEFRWVKVSPSHRLLAAGVSRSEGYAGGGGNFSGEVLLAVKGTELKPIACYAVSRYQMFAGEWNSDGTRQHQESQAAWALRLVEGGEWPNLLLRPVTRRTPSALLIWDPVAFVYQSR